MSTNIDALDALFLEVLGEDSKPHHGQHHEQAQPKVLQSVESASEFLRQTGELAIGLEFKLSA
jgi:hypothetical protein